MPDNKKFFKEQFLEFIKEEKNFFSHYQKRFIANFLKILEKNYPNIKLNKDDMENLNNFYKGLFLNPALKTSDYHDLISIFDLLNHYKIEKNIINKSFLLMTNHYIKYIFATSNIQRLKKLINLIDFYIDFLNYHFKEDYFINKLPKEIYKFYRSKQNLYVFGVYKGVPISHNTTIISVNKEENSIKIYANNYQIVAAKFQKEIYLLEPKSNTTLKAYVSNVQSYQKILTLTNIEKIDRSIAKRNYIRVQPKDKTEVKIQYKDKEYTGSIYDLSIKGISIISKKIPMDINDSALISFTLSAKNEVCYFGFLSELRSISTYSDNLFRYHFYFEPNHKEESDLEKYVKYREKEIVKELIFYLNKEFIELD